MMRENARVNKKCGKMPAGLHDVAGYVSFRQYLQGVAMLGEMLTGLRNRFGSRQVDVLQPAGHFAIVLEEVIEEQPEDAVPLALPLALFIEYQDAKGATSRRRIACKSYDVARDTIKAYCFERKSPRAFKVDRIREAVAVDTGEVLPLELVVQQLRGSALPVHDERLARVLTVLVFLMRCDGHVHGLEREVIEDAATAFAMRFDGNDETVERALVASLRTAPDVDDLILALQWIAARPECLALVRLLVPLVDRVVTADGQVTSEEAYFGGVVLDALKAMGPK